jgi:hypothetical protein
MIRIRVLAVSSADTTLATAAPQAGRRFWSDYSEGIDEEDGLAAAGVRLFGFDVVISERGGR